jgi:hypothetical protein
MTIMAMRAAGRDDDDIAKELSIGRASISSYVYRAAKNNWITADTPADRVKVELLHKTVDRIKEGLDDSTRHNTSGMMVRTAVAMDLAKGTIFKEFEAGDAKSVPNTIVAVQVVMPDGAPQAMREDTAGGRPNYIEGDVK